MNRRKEKQTNGIGSLDQGDLIMMNFDPTKGHEQAGYRPAVIVSNKDYMKFMQLAIVCPVTNHRKDFPSHILLDERTVTTGAVLCEHLRTVDLQARDAKFVEKLPLDIFEDVKDCIQSCFD